MPPHQLGDRRDVCLTLRERIGQERFREGKPGASRERLPGAGADVNRAALAPQGSHDRQRRPLFPVQDDDSWCQPRQVAAIFRGPWAALEGSSRACIGSRSRAGVGVRDGETLGASKQGKAILRPTKPSEESGRIKARVLQAGVLHQRNMAGPCPVPVGHVPCSPSAAMQLDRFHLRHLRRQPPS